MQQQFSNFKEFFKSIQILHAALFFGMVMMMIILKFILGVGDTSDDDLLFPGIGIGLAISSLIMGQILFNKKMEELKQKQFTVAEKLETYRSAFIMKLALLEGPALVCLILHFLGGNPLLFYTFIFILIIFAFERPMMRKIQDQLKLQGEDLA